MKLGTKIAWVVLLLAIVLWIYETHVRFPCYDRTLTYEQCQEVLRS